jgi:hypothetical protein
VPEEDAFEALNALFKGPIGIGKAVTFHDKPEATWLQVFEVFMDFLSYLAKGKPSQPIGAVLVLNSRNLWRRPLPYINDPHFAEVCCTWITTTQAARPAANFLKTRKMHRNLLICVATAQVVRISTPGSSGANRKLCLFHPFLFPKIESNNPS